MKTGACFCPQCHKRIIPPKMLANVKIAGTGKITLNCGDDKCSGKVTIKPLEEIDEVKEME